MRVVIALGSNLGDRLANLKNAATAVAKLTAGSMHKSAVYESWPVDCPPGSNQFLNTIVEIEVDDKTSPDQLLGQLKRIESKLGRKPKQILNEPRVIDLDLISCGSIRVNSPELMLPHPRAHQRRFVLQPLCDLDSDLVLPGQTRSVAKLLADLPDDGSLRLFAREW